MLQDVVPAQVLQGEGSRVRRWTRGDRVAEEETA